MQPIYRHSETSIATAAVSLLIRVINMKLNINVCTETLTECNVIVHKLLVYSTLCLAVRKLVKTRRAQVKTTSLHSVKFHTFCQ